MPVAGLPHYDGACALTGPGDDAPPPRLLEAPVADEAALLQPLSWEAAGVKAQGTLGRMSADDKHKLLTGLGWDGDLQKWFYVGNTAPIPELGIPSLNMQDAASGFRTYWSELVGTVTCWPSLLAMAATWDPNAVESYARAVGKEFKGKGANGILGPSVDVHRVARNGRNFEYLSGEDPYLGSVLAKAYVRGVQSQGVFAVMKHWIFNSQETNRDYQSSIVDDKTAWELYYPPFQAAVDAGVSAAMCSYNRIGGQYSCANEKTLQTVLKDQMGFKGFIQTDWWAAKAMGMPAGLDQEMPGSHGGGPGSDVFFTPEGLASQDPQRVDDAVYRVLSVIYRLQLETSTPCSAPGCEEWFRKNVTSEAHASLARSLATESVVLLKNDGDLLPISSRVGRIAVLGAASVAEAYDPNGGGQNGGGDWATGDYYSGGGSGHMVSGRLITPLRGISSRAAAGNIEVASSPTDDVEAGLEAAGAADLVVVVAATTSGESRDRESLALDGGVGDLIGALSAQHGDRLVVLVQSPGAFVAPWRDSVAGILAMFLGGQETGAAWASILFGDRSPAGRLPLMLPATEDDQILPGTGDDVTYSEGTETSYRNPKFKAAFPFGHGLAYTTFEHLSPVAVPCGGRATAAVVRRLTAEEQGAPAICIRARVRNTGRASGQDVVQLYLEFPPEAQRPGRLLKGFQKTGVIAPGDVTEVVMPLTLRDLSYYDASAARWMEAAGVTAHVGASSADLRAPPVRLARDAATGEWQESRDSPAQWPGVLPEAPVPSPPASAGAAGGPAADEEDIIAPPVVSGDHEPEAPSTSRPQKREAPPRSAEDESFEEGDGSEEGDSFSGPALVVMFLLLACASVCVAGAYAGGHVEESPQGAAPGLWRTLGPTFAPAAASLGEAGAALRSRLAALAAQLPGQLPVWLESLTANWHIEGAPAVAFRTRRGSAEDPAHAASLSEQAAAALASVSEALEGAWDGLWGHLGSGAAPVAPWDSAPTSPSAVKAFGSPHRRPHSPGISPQAVRDGAGGLRSPGFSPALGPSSPASDRGTPGRRGW